MSDLESIYMQKNNNEDSDLLSAYSKNKSSFLTNDNEINSSSIFVKHNSIIDSIESKTPESPLTSMFNQPTIEIQSKNETPEFLNEDNLSNDLNVRGSRYGNMSITDKMRGMQANRLNIEAGDISLAEMYNDSSLDNRVAGGRYNVTMSDIYSDERKWRALHGLNTDGKIEIAENYQVDNEIVKAKEIQNSNQIEFNNKMSLSKPDTGSQSNVPGSSLLNNAQSNVPDSSLLNNAQSKVPGSSLLNNAQSNIPGSSLLNNTQLNTPAINLFSSDQYQQNEGTSGLIAKYTGNTIANQQTSNLMSDSSEIKDISELNKIEVIKNKKIDIGSNLLKGNPDIYDLYEVEKTISIENNSPDLINKYSVTNSGANTSNLMSDIEKKETQLEDKLNNITKIISLSEIYKEDKIVVDNNEHKNIFNSSENNNFISYSEKEKEDLNLIDKINLKNNKSEIVDNSLITAGVVTTSIISKDNENNNFIPIDLSNKSHKQNNLENNLFDGKVNSESFNFEEYLRKKIQNKNFLSELNLQELIILKNELLILINEDKNINNIESIEIKIKEISKEMIRKMF